jgi:hypothetical protein
MPSLLDNCKVGHFHGYARLPGTVALHGNQKYEDRCLHWAGRVLYKEGNREISSGKTSEQSVPSASSKRSVLAVS